MSTPIALQPKVLLLDEPFGRLDSLTRMELQDVIIDILAKEKLTAMIVTHDVDEAVFMADRCVMMSNGPKAGVGEILEIDFPRPRNREAVANGETLGFLSKEEIEELRIKNEGQR